MNSKQSYWYLLTALLISAPTPSMAAEAEEAGKFMARGAGAVAGTVTGCILPVLAAGLAKSKLSKIGPPREGQILAGLCSAGAIAGGGAAWKASDQYLNPSIPSEEQMQTEGDERAQSEE